MSSLHLPQHVQVRAGAVWCLARNENRGCASSAILRRPASAAMAKTRHKSWRTLHVLRPTWRRGR
jgi:hypothetical protein